jgi:hypothetical protein
MFIGFLLFAIFMMAFGGAMMITHRRAKLDQSFGLYSPLILIGLGIVLRGFDVIPSLGLWILVGIAVLILAASVYHMLDRSRETGMC